MSTKSPPGDDYSVIYSIIKIGSIRRQHDLATQYTSYTVRTHGTRDVIRVEPGSQAQRCIRYFGGRLEMKDLLATSCRNKDGEVSIHYIDVI